MSKKGSIIVLSSIFAALLIVTTVMVCFGLPLWLIVFVVIITTGLLAYYARRVFGNSTHDKLRLYALLFSLACGSIVFPLGILMLLHNRDHVALSALLLVASFSMIIISILQLVHSHR